MLLLVVVPKKQTCRVCDGLCAHLGDGKVPVVDKACERGGAGAVHEAVREEPEPAPLVCLAAHLDERPVAHKGVVGQHNVLEHVARAACERVLDLAQLLAVGLALDLLVHRRGQRVQRRDQAARVVVVGVVARRAVAVLLEQQVVARQPLHRRDQVHRQVPAAALRVLLDLPHKALELAAPPRLVLQRLHRVPVLLHVQPVRLEHLWALRHTH